MGYIFKMLGQPSSYAGLSATSAAFAATHVGTPLGSVAAIASGAFGLLAFFLDGRPHG